jgi:hypothetical protein
MKENNPLAFRIQLSIIITVWLNMFDAKMITIRSTFLVDKATFKIWETGIPNLGNINFLICYEV